MLGHTIPADPTLGGCIFRNCLIRDSIRYAMSPLIKYFATRHYSFLDHKRGGDESCYRCLCRVNQISSWLRYVPTSPLTLQATVLHSQRRLITEETTKPATSDGREEATTNGSSPGWFSISTVRSLSLTPFTSSTSTHDSSPTTQVINHFVPVGMHESGFSPQLISTIYGDSTCAYHVLRSPLGTYSSTYSH